MTSPRNPVPDAASSQLRELAATIDLEISRLATSRTLDDNGIPRSNLLASWSELVQKLALGPECEEPRCPVCQRTGVRTATRCWHCWMLDEADAIHRK